MRILPMRRPEIIDPMTRQRNYIHREGGLSHRRSAELKRTSVNTFMASMGANPPFRRSRIAVIERE
jgi:hypothetical protein